MQNELPNDVKDLKSLVVSFDIENKQLKMDKQFLEERVRLLEHKLFGPKSESRKSEKELAQDSLFNEAELAVAQKDEELKNESEAVADEVPVKGHTRKKSPGRKSLPEDLPRVEVVIELDDDRKFCEHDGTELKKIGEEVSEKVDVVPSHIRVEKTIRHKYVCHCCQSFLTAPLPPQAFPKSLATNQTVAFIVMSKYADGLPLYRQSKMFERMGFELNRKTMASWMIQASDVLKPVYDLIREELVALPILHADETRLQVLNEPGRAATTQSFMWAIASSYYEERKAVYFEYHMGRSGKDAEHLLDGFKGSLVCDGFDGYQTYCTRTGVIRCGCWAHARRKFDEAYKASHKGAGVAAEMLDHIDKLFLIERSVKSLSTDERLARRQLDSVDVLRAMRESLEKYLPGVPPKSLLGAALGYLSNEWDYLIRFITNGDVPIENNRLENAIRPFAIGRKNWLFSDTQNGAHASATLYTLVESAKLNRLNVFDYFKDLFDKIPAIDPEDRDAMLRLMPWNWKPQGASIN